MPPFLGRRSAALRPSCSLCTKPVKLEISKTDHNGKAVHEECYVLALKKEPPQKPLTQKLAA